jgi:hypothetical protein
MNMDRAAHSDSPGRLRLGVFSAVFPSLPLVCFLFYFSLSHPKHRHFFLSHPAPTATGLASPPSHPQPCRRLQARDSLEILWISAGA